MSVVVVGLNQRTTPLSVLEPMTVPPARMAKALHDLSGRDHLSEAVVLSTCLRTEIYAVASRFHGAMSDIRNFFSEWSGIPPEDFSDQLYSYYDEAAAQHLFKVAAGLDSAVLGEGEILGQVGDAWEAARQEAVSGPMLSILFRQALEVGKRVRSETAIARGTTSLSQAAVALAAASWGRSQGRRRSCSVRAKWAKPWPKPWPAALDGGALLVANRTWSGPTQLADRCGGRAVEWSALPNALVRADVLLASTGAPTVLLEAADLEPVLAERAGRPLLIVDMAVPRDVDPGVGVLPGVTLLDMDDLTASAAVGMAGRRQEVPRAEAIVAEEVDALPRRGCPAARGAAWCRRCTSGARRSALAELDRFRRRLVGLEPEPGCGGGGADPGDRGQVAPRADRQGQGGGRHTERRAAGPGVAPAVRART